MWLLAGFSSLLAAGHRLPSVPCQMLHRYMTWTDWESQEAGEGVLRRWKSQYFFSFFVLENNFLQRGKNWSSNINWKVGYCDVEMQNWHFVKYAFFEWFWIILLFSLLTSFTYFSHSQPLLLETTNLFSASMSLLIYKLIFKVILHLLCHILFIRS